MTHARLRIGYVSADFRGHATAHLMQGLFALHDRSRFEIIGYSLRQAPDNPYQQQIAADCDRFVDLTALSNAEAAQRIQDEEIHILVDLMGYTNHSRSEIFARRPAPIQVNYLGFPGTTGADFIDYIIADTVVLPESQLLLSLPSNRSICLNVIRSLIARRSPPPASPVKMRVCRRRVLSFAPSTAIRNWSRKYSISGCGCCTNALTASCGYWCTPLSQSGTHLT